MTEISVFNTIADATKMTVSGESLLHERLLMGFELHVEVASVILCKIFNSFHSLNFFYCF